MKHEEGKFSNNKGQSLYYQYWIPEGKVKASLFIVHGLNEHCGRYQHLASYLVDQGYAVYGMDLPGHGKSDGLRSYVDSYIDLIKPMDSYLDMIKTWQPGVPVFMVGHSMGGLLASAFLSEHIGQVDGAVLSGSLVKVPDYVSEFTIRVGKILSKVLPKFRLIEVDKQGLSRDPGVVQAYYDDPLVFTGKSTVRLSNEINNAITFVENNGHKIQEPLLILHGGDDRVCDPSWSQYLHKLISSPDKELIIYEGLYHEIYNEPEAESIFADVLSWLERQIG